MSKSFSLCRIFFFAERNIADDEASKVLSFQVKEIVPFVAFHDKTMGRELCMTYNKIGK